MISFLRWLRVRSSFNAHRPNPIWPFLHCSLHCVFCKNRRRYCKTPYLLSYYNRLQGSSRVLLSYSPTTLVVNYTLVTWFLPRQVIGWRQGSFTPSVDVWQMHQYSVSKVTATDIASHIAGQSRVTNNDTVWDISDFSTYWYNTTNRFQLLHIARWWH